jgi:hypothetical protein
MRTRLSLFVLLVSACVFLASLYLVWIDSTRKAAGNGIYGLMNQFSGGVSFYGWAGFYGSAAALAAVALLLGAGASLLRPQRPRRLPLASAGLALLYLALLNAAYLQGTGVFEGAFQHVSIHLASGAYLGIGSAGVAFLAAVGTRWEEVARRPSVSALVALALTAGLLAAFILPWLHVHVPPTGGAIGYQISNRGNGVVVFITAISCFGLPLWTRGTPPGRRLFAALGIVVLVAGGLSTLGTHLHWPYEAWLGLGCSLGLVALALATSRGLRISLPPVADAAAGAAATLLVVSMFLPWQKVCDPVGRGCASYSGWSPAQGPPTGALASTAGGLAVILLVLLLGYRRLYVELAVGAAIYVMAAGFEITRAPFPPPTHLGYGAPLGFAGAALLLVAAARRLGSVPPDRTRLLLRFVPMLACLAFLAIPVATLTGRLSPLFDAYSPWRWDWLELGAILVALRLLGRWLGGPKADDELVLLPLALLAMTVLTVVEADRAGYVNWEAWLSVSLCALLAVLGWLERTSGLESVRVPEEIWRLDRLPGES